MWCAAGLVAAEADVGCSEGDDEDDAAAAGASSMCTLADCSPSAHSASSTPEI